MRFILFISLWFILHLVSADKYRLCYTKDAENQMKNLFKEKADLNVEGVLAKDRYECLQKISKNEADFVPVEPEDMFVASGLSSSNTFQLIKEIRTKSEIIEEHRYEAVAVIHKNANIHNINDLRGKKSCHTGMGRTVGYKIPVTKLSQLKVIEALTSEDDITPREHELRALSKAFQSACIVGSWAPDDYTNRIWKGKYPNLCALCENPEKCDYPDKYSGYEGALKCLTTGGGDVAWTKVIIVNKFFAIKDGEGSEPQANVDDYAYLCPDGSKADITGTPCSWAARPWTGIITRKNVNVQDLQRTISLIETTSQNGQYVLGLTDKTTAVDILPISLDDFLRRSNYDDVISREVGQNSTLRLCTINSLEQEKCLGLAAVSFSRDVRPALSCIEKSSVTDCMTAIKGRKADIVMLDGEDGYDANRNYNMHPIMAENYTNDAYSYVVALIKINSNLNSLENLRGQQSCHPKFNDLSGWKLPIAVLKAKGLIEYTEVNDLNIMNSAKHFFGGLCAPGSNSTTVCSQCTVTQGEIPCPADNREEFYDEKGAILCLKRNKGDVAFIKASTLIANTDLEASGIKLGEYKLLCANGGTASVYEYKECHIAKIPPKSLFVSDYAFESTTETIQMALLSASKSFSNGNIFQMFGPSNLIFSDKANGLQILDGNFPDHRNFFTKLDVYYKP